MYEILEAAGYALAFLAVSLVVLGAGFWILDLITPGHHLATRLTGEPGAPGVPYMGDDERLRGTRDGYVKATEASHSAALVTSAWMLVQGAIIFTAIWTNAHGTDFAAALGWTLAFSVIGLLMQTAAFFALDLVTPGKLADEVCAPGAAVPLAKVAAANILAVGLVVIASIS